MGGEGRAFRPSGPCTPATPKGAPRQTLVFTFGGPMERFLVNETGQRAHGRFWQACGAVTDSLTRDGFFRRSLVWRSITAALSHAFVTLNVITIVMAPSALAQSVPGRVALTWPPRLSKTADAMPRLRDTSGPAARSINAALGAADRRLKRAIEQCAKEAHEDGAIGSEWDRKVTVAMAGPGLLSLVTEDSAFCGGAHPNFQSFALTFDLRTGKPLNWKRLLPAPLIETTTTEDAMDGTTMGVVRSKLLVRLDTDPSQDCGMGEDATFQLWPDAKKGGVQFAWTDPPHVNENCGEPALIDLVTLRKYGASPLLIQLLAQASEGKQ